MNSEETLKTTLVSFIQGYKPTKERIEILISNIEETIKNSTLFKTLNEVCNVYRVRMLQRDMAWVHDDVNNVHYSIELRRTPKILIESNVDFKLEIYPTRNEIQIKIVDSYFQFETLFSYDTNAGNLQEKVHQIDNSYEKRVEDKLLKLLFILNNDKLLDIATKKLIGTLSTTMELSNFS